MSQTKAQLIDTLVASLLPASDSSVDIGSSAVRFANIYGDTLYGNGANLTGINTDLVSDTSPQLGGNLDTNSKNIDFGDSSSGTVNRLRFGASTDLEIFHNGSHNHIDCHTTGQDLFIRPTRDVYFQDYVSDDKLIKMVKDGAVELYYDNSKKFETASTGITITGGFTTSGGSAFNSTISFNDDASFYGANYHVFFDRSESAFEFQDGAKATFGTDNDLQIYHESNNSWIKELGAGSLNINTNRLNVANAADNEVIINALENGAVELYYDNSKKFETTSNGISVGSVTIDSGFNNIALPDDGQIRFGLHEDLRIYHSGGDNFINIPYDAELRLVHNSEYMARFFAEGAVKLYYDNSEKLETRPTGLRMQNSSTFDVNGGLIKFGNCSSAGSDDTLMFGGNGDDLKIFHGGNAQFDNNTGHLEIRNVGDFSSTREIRIRARVDENYLNLYSDGAVKLYYDSGQKLETKSNGVGITGNLQCNNTLSCGTGLQQANVASFGGGTSNQINIFDGSNTGWGLLLTQSQGNNTSSGYHYTTNSSVSKPCAIVNVQNDALHFATNNTPRFRIEHDGHVIPSANNSYDLGSSGYKWRNIYTNDLNLSNEGSSNDVDGTWGSYTIQEGAEDLFLVNKRNGKKYKFNLTEVS